jgi:hypothetical protein
MHVDESIYARIGRQDRVAGRVPLWPVLVAAEALDYADWYGAGWFKREHVVRVVREAIRKHGEPATMRAIHGVVPEATVFGDVEPIHFRRIVEAMLRLRRAA